MILSASLFQILHHIPDENANLLNALADLVNNFCPEQIIHITENSAE